MFLFSTFPFCLSVSSKFSTLNNYCLYKKQKNPKKERTLGWNSGALVSAVQLILTYLAVGLQGILLISKREGLELRGAGVFSLGPAAEYTTGLPSLECTLLSEFCHP